MRARTILAAALLTLGTAATATADANYWVSMGRERFVGRNDREANLPGWSGRSIEKLGLRANDFAACPRVRVTFGNGNTRDLSSAGLMRMMPGRVYRLDLPGNSRNVTRIVLRCHSLVDRGVQVELLARK